MSGGDAWPEAFDAVRLRMTALRSILRESAGRDRLGATRELQRLVVQASRRYGPDDELVIGCERSILEIDWRARSLRERHQALEELLVRAREHLGDAHRETRAIANFVASALRKIDRAAGIAAYRDELHTRERLYPPDHRTVRYSRTNLAFALRSPGASTDDLDEARDLLRAEWDQRRAVFGDDDAFTWMAAHAYAHTCLEAALVGRPYESVPHLVRLLEEIVDARQRILGTAHRRTVFAKITLAEARVLAGDTESAVWALIALRAEADAVGVDEPERIPRILMRALGGSADEADRQAAVGFGREALEHLLDVYGQGYPLTIAVQEEIGRISRSLG